MLLSSLICRFSVDLCTLHPLLRWSLALSLYGQLCWHLNNTCYSKSGMMLAMLIDLLSEMLFENGLTREYTQAELAWNPPFQSMQCLAS